MNTLINLQSQFAYSLLNNSNDIEQYLNTGKLTDAYSPVNIYQNAYRLRLIESLKTDFPILEQLVGSDSFNELAGEYINEYPSRSFSLRYFGQHLSAFLKKDSVYRQQLYLSEIAEFEWQLIDVFDLADSPIANLEDITKIEAKDWPRLTIKLQTSIRWVSTRWNVVEVYQALRTQSKVPDLIRFETPQRCLIWRKEYSPFYRIVEDREWFALKILENSNFSELCLTLSAIDQSEENASSDAVTYLKSWITADLLESVSISN